MPEDTLGQVCVFSRPVLQRGMYQGDKQTGTNLSRKRDLSVQKTDCRETRRNIDEVKLRLVTLEDQMSHILTGINCLTQAVKTLNPQKALKVKEDIIVVGGRNKTRLNSAEMFSWSDRAWVQLPPMKEVRSGASSVVYENKVIVSGGRCGDKEDVIPSDTMEALTLDNKAKEWLGVPPRLPYKVVGHQCLVYKDRLFLLGGYNNAIVFDAIFEIFLTPPYSSKLVHRLPEPVCNHGAERFGNNIYIVGGTPDDCDCTDNVVKYDVNTHECTKMPALPFAAEGMATVIWQNNVITLGGENVDDEALDTVVMYDIESGKSKLLPTMKYKRRGCAAVVSNNAVVVMGGKDENDECLNTVESFSFDRYCWEELPPMIEPRSYATAVVKCCNFS